MSLKFGLIGDGSIARYHKAAIKYIGGELVASFDPRYRFDSLYDQRRHTIFSADFFKNLDFAVICSPSIYHYEQIKFSLKYLSPGAHIICEKPAFLPWQPIIDNDRINVIMQLRNLDLSALNIEKIEVQMIRDDNYMRSWRGRLVNTGGFIFSLFIHYIDMAIKHRCKFEGRVLPKGKNFFKIDNQEVENDKQAFFDCEYEKIIAGKGNKPKDLFYLYWVLNQLIEQYGPGEMYQQIEFDGSRYGI